jgi:serine phosphatase RsbU (regulator of sigma subunit)
MRFSTRMASRRGTFPMAPAPPPNATPAPSARHLLLHSWPGRIFLASAALKLVVALLRLAGVLAAVADILSTIATIGLVISLSYFVWRLIVLAKRRLLWRVRRRLILSYVFFGVVPALLIVGFFILGAWVLSMNVSAYLFRDGYDDVVEDARLVARAAAADIARSPGEAQQIVDQVHRNISSRYPTVSLVFLPEPNRPEAMASAGRWDHAPRPDTLPAWARERADTDGFSGAVALPSSDPGVEWALAVRVVASVQGPKGDAGVLVLDVPLDEEVLQRLHEQTSVTGGAVWVADADDTNAVVPSVPGQTGGGLFSASVVGIECREWGTGTVRRATIGLRYRVSEVYDKLTSAQSLQIGRQTLGQLLVSVLIFAAVLFLIIQLAALAMGMTLARSITSSIHELFTGTERVRLGDFSHRINIPTNDQLGELAASFNQMTGSIENLLQTAAEKKRMEEELRIARQIQMSLLPRGPLDVPGLGITALCVPAREVGGDYYDFFPLGEDRLGVLIADVSGKGTSAALYMAELKGLVLALSQQFGSPRELLLEVNRILSENLDSRSFITMTYAVMDLRAAHMTFCRAGHTPLIFLPGPSAPRANARVLTPSGMVVGLRLPGAGDKFAELLEEETVPLNADDVIVLYTDGITEAMNPSSDLFGEARLSRIVEEHGHLDSGELRERILREIEAFVGSADQHDDMTMILLKVTRMGAAVERVAV